MEEFNRTLFLWLNAPEHPNALILSLAIFCARWLIFVVPILIGAGWMCGNERIRKTMLMAAVAGGLGLFVGQCIGLVWFHPRPFMVGLGHLLIHHPADASFPSNHLTLWWSVAFSLLMQRTSRRSGALLVLAGLPIAWARIYLGVHFPLDMLGAAVVGALSAWLSLRAAPWYLPSIYSLALRAHRLVFNGR